MTKGRNPKYLHQLQPPDFTEVAEQGCFVYCYLRSRNTSAPAGTPYYIGIASSYARPTGPHTCTVPRNRARIRVMRSGLTREQAEDWERRYISHYGRKDAGTGILHNRTDGGEGASGLIHSEEAKATLSRKLKDNKNGLGHVPTPQKRRRIRQKLTGIKHTAERRRNQSLAKVGIPLPEGSVAKRSATVIRQRAELNGYTVEEWEALTHTEKTKVARWRRLGKPYGLTPREYGALTHAQKVGLHEGAWNLPKIYAAADAAGIPRDQWLSLAPREREAMRLAILKAKAYGYSLEDWLALSRGEQIAAAKDHKNESRRRADAERFGIPADEYLAMTAMQRTKAKEKAARARAYGYTWQEWNAMGRGERIAASQRKT
jgi:hypothetical protein